MAGTRSYELRTKSKEELLKQLVELKQELANLKVQKLLKPSLPRIHTVRKNIARVLTIINLNQRETVKAFYADSKYAPKDMRAKKTRAIRRQLTKLEQRAETDKARKNRIAFPQRKFAIQA